MVSACDRCHSRKAACTGELPCQACQRSNSLCQYPRNAPESVLAAGALADVPVEPRMPGPTAQPSLHASGSVQDRPAGDGCSGVDALMLAEQSGHTTPQAAHVPTPGRLERNGSIATLSSNEASWEALDRPESQHPREIQAEAVHLTYPLVSPQSPGRDYRVEPFAPLWSLEAEAALQAADPEQPWPRSPVTSDTSHAITIALSSTDETGALSGDLSNLGHDDTCLDGPSRDVMPAGATAPTFQLDTQTLDYIFDSTFHGTALPLSAQDLWLPAPSGIFNSTIPFLSTTNEVGLPRSSHSDAWALDSMPLYSEPSDTVPRAALPSLFPLGSLTLKHCIDVFFAKFHRLWATVHRATFNPEADDQDLVDTMAMIGAWESGIPSWMDAALALHKSITEKLRERLVCHQI